MIPGEAVYPAPCQAGDFRLVREILDRIGDMWSLYVIAMLRDGPVRFNRLRRQIDGISQRMLTITLRGLERDGLVTRTLFATIPPRVDYALTEEGRTLLEPVMALVAWANSNQEVIRQARTRYDKNYTENHYRT